MKLYNWKIVTAKLVEAHYTKVEDQNFVGTIANLRKIAFGCQCARCTVLPKET